MILLKIKPGIWTQRKKPKHSLCLAVSLGCFSVLPAVPVQVCRDWVSSQDKEGAGLEMVVEGDSHSSPRSCHWFQAQGHPWVPQLSHSPRVQPHLGFPALLRLQLEALLSWQCLTATFSSCEKCLSANHQGWHSQCHPSQASMMQT